MTNTLKVAVVGLFFLTPFIGYAAQKAITQAQLSASYSAQVASLNAQMSNDTNDMQGLLAAGLINPNNTGGYYEKRPANIYYKGQTLTYATANTQYLADEAQIAQDKIDAHTLQVAYQMLVNAFQ